VVKFLVTLVTNLCALCGKKQQELKTMKKTIPLLFILLTVATLFAQTYFTGDGGKGKRLAVLEPTGRGIADNEKWMLPLIQGSIVGDFKKFSAMTLIDRQNIEKVMQDQLKALNTGYYSDTDFVSIGNSMNARIIVTGFLSKTANTYMLEFSVTDAETHEQLATYSPKSVTLESIENLSAVKEATADLLTQLGVTLTSSGLTELKKPLVINQIHGETALSQGIIAQRQGTEITAQSYYRLASAFDPSLIEATSRSQIVSANINSSNMGENVRNDIRWRDQWVARLSEFENFVSKLMDDIKNNDPPYSLIYSTDISQGETNYQTRTVDLSIGTHMQTNNEWMQAVSKGINDVYQEIYRGLDLTGRKDTWQLGTWPQKGITRDVVFDIVWQIEITVVFELVNNNNQTINKQTKIWKPNFRLSVDNNQVKGNYEHFNIERLVFSSVKADEITDNMTIKIVSVNGALPQNERLSLLSVPHYLGIKNGDIIDFGNLKWRVLDVQKDQALIITEKIVEMRVYNQTADDISWEYCNLRYYLNGEWLNKNFTQSERQRIEQKTIITRIFAEYNQNTKDYVFLIDNNEVKRYFPSSKDRVVLNESGDAISWWLRKSGFSSSSASYVRRDGFVGDTSLVFRSNGIRPAMWIKL
jgi:hypothetical protein